MKQQDVVSNLKLRLGWGVVGNDRISNYLSMDLYTQGKYGYGNSIVTVLSPKQLANKDLKWEASQSTNIGIDLGLFNNRLNVTADFFLKDTKDLLMASNKAYVSGFASQWKNVGKIRNKGIELAVNSTNISSRSGFRWTTDLNISFIRQRTAFAGRRRLEHGCQFELERRLHDFRLYCADRTVAGFDLRL